MLKSLYLSFFNPSPFQILEFLPSYVFILGFAGLMSNLPELRGKVPFLLGSLLYTWYYKDLSAVKSGLG